MLEVKEPVGGLPQSWYLLIMAAVLYQALARNLADQASSKLYADPEAEDKYVSKIPWEIQSHVFLT